MIAAENASDAKAAIGQTLRRDGTRELRGEAALPSIPTEPPEAI
jgi:hypothetical protein